MSTGYPKKYWWLVLIVLPVVVAVIGILDLGKKQEKGDGDTIIVASSQFNGDVAFNTMNVIVDQARKALPEELPEDVVQTLRQAMNLVQSRNFEEAIPLLQSAAEAAPVPALFNNVGAAYLATGNFSKASEYLERAHTNTQKGTTTTTFNIKQVKVAQDQTKNHASKAEEIPIGPISEEVSQQGSDQLRPAEGGYASIRFYVGSVRGRRYTVRVNNLPIGIYESDQKIVLDRFLTSGARNTVMWDFTQPGSDVEIYVKFKQRKEDWFLIYQFKTRKDRLTGSFSFPFAGPNQ